MVALAQLGGWEIALALLLVGVLSSWEVREAQRHTSPGAWRLLASLPGIVAPLTACHLLLDPAVNPVAVTGLVGERAPAAPDRAPPHPPPAGPRLGPRPSRRACPSQPSSSAS